MDDVLLWGFIVFGVMIAVIVICVVWDMRKNKDKYEKISEEAIDKKFSEEAEIMTFHAEIADMICGAGMVGSYNLPKSEKTFVLIFKDDEGKCFELRVSENIYTSLEVGMKGMLTILEGQLDSFELDEE